ncbi:MAG: FixH family protein [Pseudomonadota bacterium]
MVKEFRVTGKFVLGALLCFFLTIMSVNIIFVNFAVKTFPGEKEEKSYLQGLNFNSRLADRERQKNLGWKVEVNDFQRSNERLVIALSVHGAKGDPLDGLDVRGVISRPTNETFDQDVVFSSVGNGRYETSVRGGAGVWILEGEAVSGQNEAFEFQSRLLLD